MSMTKISKIINSVNNDIWGESPLSFYFSFNGFFNRLQFFGALITLNFFLNLMSSTENFIIHLLALGIVFYSTLAVIQKRSRDLNMKGTFFILIFSLANPMNIYLQTMKSINLPVNFYIQKGFGVVLVLYLLVFLFLQFMPEKKEKNPELISPLLKHPNIYFVVCVLISALGFGILKNL